VRLDDAAFRKHFAGTPIKRTGRDCFVRNVLIAIGNSRDRRLAGEAIPLREDPSPLVRAMAVWALSRLVDGRSFSGLAARHAARETDTNVLGEWQEGAARLAETERAA
jgi:epoxyqueuosine reductase